MFFKDSLAKIVSNNKGLDFIKNQDFNKTEFKFLEKAYFLAKQNYDKDYFNLVLNSTKTIYKIKPDLNLLITLFLKRIDFKFVKTEFPKQIVFLLEKLNDLEKIRYQRNLKNKKKNLEKIENFKNLFLILATDLRVILIRLVQKLEEAKNFHNYPEKEAKKMGEEILDIYSPIAGRLGICKLKGELEDCSFPFVYPKEYKNLMEQLKESYKERESYLNKNKKILEEKLKKEDIHLIGVQTRSKYCYSLFQKIKKHQGDISKIYDLVAIRIIVETIEDCYKVLGVIHKHWKPLPNRIKDYIALPKPNGYRSLHTTVFFVQGKIVEIQIRTKKMHQHAEYGIACHWHYNENKGFKSYLKKIIVKVSKKEIEFVKKIREAIKERVDFNDFELLKTDFLEKRIYVFTPKGDLIDLPQGATPIDFAYHIHSKIGEHCALVKVNNKIEALSYKLNNGDIVEIITSKKKSPSLNWLSFVKTSTAKIKIKKYFEKSRTSLKERLKEKIRKIKEIKIKEKFSKIRNIFKNSELTVEIEGIKGIAYYLAKCCEPKFEDKIFAYLTDKSLFSIHKQNCQETKELRKKNQNKIFRAKWST